MGTQFLTTVIITIYFYNMLYTIVYFCGLHGTPVIIIVLDFHFFFGNTFIPISFLDSVKHYYAYIYVLQEYYNIRIIIICPYYYKQSSVYIINTFNTKF